MLDVVIQPGKLFASTSRGLFIISAFSSILNHSKSDVQIVQRRCVHLQRSMFSSRVAPPELVKMSVVSSVFDHGELRVLSATFLGTLGSFFIRDKDYLELEAFIR
ncbi:c3.1 [Ichnoviriform fugitivi]|uniref:C3.1 n=1 Tax=Ichnoviriform fugitivi TaxID=265522 RepID=A2Q0F9_9VIRU|nr:c3.1 [Ichnoviriform fugitivi]BAF45674.1 c3.1 [Ichnoviriform fugitivi]